ncbi:MAG: hypothetical protein AAFQ42_05545 [Pseudomonadota bacterium]
MTQTDQTTWHTIRYRLTDPVAGVTAWQAEAFGLLLAERAYPVLQATCRENASDAYGLFRHGLGRLWDHLEGRMSPRLRLVQPDDIEALARALPDTATAARAVAAATICQHLVRFVASGDRGDIAQAAITAYAGALTAWAPGYRLPDDGDWARAIPFDEIDVFAQTVANAPEVQAEVLRQAADLAFIEALRGERAAQFDAMRRRAFLPGTPAADDASSIAPSRAG